MVVAAVNRRTGIFEKGYPAGPFAGPFSLQTALVLQTSLFSSIFLLMLMFLFFGCYPFSFRFHSFSCGSTDYLIVWDQSVRPAPATDRGPGPVGAVLISLLDFAFFGSLLIFLSQNTSRYFVLVTFLALFLSMNRCRISGLTRRGRKCLQCRCGITVEKRQFPIGCAYQSPFFFSILNSYFRWCHSILPIGLL